MSLEPKIEAMSLSGLASAYKVSASTMKKWLERAELIRKKTDGYIYTPKQVEQIYNHLGNP